MSSLDTKRAVRPSFVRVERDITPVDDWTLREEPMPESRPHDLILDLLKALLLAWVARARRHAQVGRNLAIRWDERHPKMGIDPDLYVVEPPPPEGDRLKSLCLWKPGHVAPVLAIEVVSAHRPQKDYVIAPQKCAASGIGELWIFDPELLGTETSGGPHRLQIWERDEEQGFSRVYAGEGPAFSNAVGAWLFAVDEGQRLRIADDEAGTSWWMTALEASQHRVAQLEAELARRSS